MLNGTHTQNAQALAAQTTTNNGNSTAVSEFSVVNAYINVTAASGTTPTLVVKLQDSHDGVNWFDSGVASSSITAIGTYRLTLVNPGNYVRPASIIGGTTPSFTYSVDFVGRNT